MDAMKDVLAAVFENLKKKQDHNPLNQAWETLLDKDARSHARILDVQDKVLRIVVENSAWGYELNLRKMNLLKQLKISGCEIENIVFFVGKI